ncbi:antibiotic biosynthesis monooxygenase family protein [Geodermatophilus sp. SYSU D00684]
MMTVLTTSTLRPGGQQEWDAVMRDRFEAARRMPGWISGQVLTPEDDPLSRVIVGTWNSREDWMAWHDDPAFLDKRTVLEGLESAPNVTRWFSVVADAGVGG